MRKIAVLAGLLAGAPGGLWAQDVLSLEAFGVVCDARPDGTREAPDTVSGILNIIDQDLPIDVTTAYVPAEIGLSFGIRARLSEDALPMTVDIVVTHPPMGPNGQQVERWSASLTPGRTALNLFSFEKPFELIEGPWLFQMRDGDDVLLEQGFTVTPRGTVPAVQQVCFGSMVLS